MKFLKYLPLVLLAVAALGFAGCGSSNSEAVYPMIQSITVVMTNTSSADANMWTHGESIDTSNNLTKDASRSRNISVDYENETEPETITVHAGQNNVELGSSKVFFTRSELPAQITATWNGDKVSIAQ